jgi:hypothetical protein
LAIPELKVASRVLDAVASAGAAGSAAIEAARAATARASPGPARHDLRDPVARRIATGLTAS